MKKVTMGFLAAFAVIALASFSFGLEKEDLEAGKAAFDEYCGKCHEAERALTRAKDRDGWEKTVDRMSGYHKRFGGPIPDEAGGAIVDFLVEKAGK